MIVSKEAQEELLAAVAWYEEQREGLGVELLDEVEAVLARIESSPRSFAIDRFDSRARRAAVARFPYAAVFIEHDGELHVVAIAHARRRPGYWRDRV